MVVEVSGNERARRYLERQLALCCLKQQREDYEVAQKNDINVRYLHFWTDEAVSIDTQSYIFAGQPPSPAPVCVDLAVKSGWYNESGNTWHCIFPGLVEGNSKK